MIRNSEMGMTNKRPSAVPTKYPGSSRKKLRKTMKHVRIAGFRPRFKVRP
jgi:hypothetical protein